jgi:alkylation response protein AidB-like acyl-CoA dehydrogenase
MSMVGGGVVSWQRLVAALLQALRRSTETWSPSGSWACPDKRKEKTAMDFGYSEEQIMLRTSARDFLEKECTKEVVRNLLFQDAKGYSPEMWKKMADLGWLGLVFPEEYDGIGSSFLDLSVLVEEMGRALLPGPFMSTVVWCGLPILNYGTEEQKKEFLPKIASGDMILSLAFYEANGGIEARDMEEVKASAAGDDYVINGRKLFVRDAHVADYLLCIARTRDSANKEEGITLFLVNAKSPGIGTTVEATMTGEKQCEVVFNNVRVSKKNILGALDQGWLIVKKILLWGAAAECSHMVGGSRWALETSVNYAKERVQFGRPIGSFQAIQHYCAAMLDDVEYATSLVMYAAWAASENAPDAPLAVSIAKAWLSDVYPRTTSQSIQIHGGIGMTWDHDMHLYFKRAKASEVLFGDADYHREMVANLIGM